MTTQALKRLRCPYCHSSFDKVETIQRSSQNNIEYGIIYCACGQFPIVAGIAYLKRKTNSVQIDTAISHLQSKRFSRAALALIQERKKVKLAYFLLIWVATHKAMKPILTFQQFVRLLRLLNPESSAWISYLSKRNQRVTFLISLATLSFAQRGHFLVDIGCGTGNFLHQATQLGKLKNMMGIDFDFSLLFLARVFFLPKTTPLVCADIHDGLPLAPNSVDMVTVNDAFMYFTQKMAFIKSIRSILRTNGNVFLTHVHRHGATNLGQGQGIRLSDIKKYQNILATSINSDQDIFTSIIKRNSIAFHSQEVITPPLAPSYSLLLQKKKNGRKSASLKPWISRYISKASIDYTEDEYLRSL